VVSAETHPVIRWLMADGRKFTRRHTADEVGEFTASASASGCLRRASLSYGRKITLPITERLAMAFSASAVLASG
jgi:hypothetical protein